MEQPYNFCVCAFHGLSLRVSFLISFLSQRNTKQFSGKWPFLKLCNVNNLVPLSKMLHFFSAEKVDNEAPDLVHIFTSVDTSAVVRIIGMTNSVKADSTWL